MVQKDSEITFKADRPSGDPNKLADYERAVSELKAAHNLFVQLSHLDRRHNPIDLKKLQTHQQYCEQAFRQSQVAPLKPACVSPLSHTLNRPSDSHVISMVPQCCKHALHQAHGSALHRMHGNPYMVESVLASCCNLWRVIAISLHYSFGAVH